MRKLPVRALLTLAFLLALAGACEARVSADELLGDIDISAGAGSPNMLDRWGTAALAAHSLERAEGLAGVLFFGDCVVAIVRGELESDEGFDAAFPTEADRTRLVLVLSQYYIARAGALFDEEQVEAAVEGMAAFCADNIEGYAERRGDLERTAALFLLMAGQPRRPATN